MTIIGSSEALSPIRKSRVFPSFIIDENQPLVRRRRWFKIRPSNLKIFLKIMKLGIFVIPAAFSNGFSEQNAISEYGRCPLKIPTSK